MKIVVLLFVLVVDRAGGQKPEFGYNPSTIGARPEIFNLPKGMSANFTCVNGGSRCAYLPKAFSKTYFGGRDAGSYTVTEDFGITRYLWTATSPKIHFFEATDCQMEPHCEVGCHADCKCISEEGSPCPMVASLAPVVAPPVAAPVAKVCTKKQNTQHCPELMKTVASRLVYDCYNFCGGIFMSSCAYSDSKNCNIKACDNNTESGVTSIVNGCTPSDRPAPTPAPNSLGGPSGKSPGGGNSGSSSSRVATGAAVILLTMVTTWV